MKQKENNNTTRRFPPERIFLVGVGAVVVGYGMYELYKKMTGQASPSEDQEALLEPTTIVNNKSAVVRNDRFPLRKGSLGNNVTLMQSGLQKILGAAAFLKLTPVDGDFGSGTEKALVQAGFPKVVDEPTFLTIVQGVSTSSTSSDPKDLAEQLFRYATQKDIQRVLSILSQLKTTSDYSALNSFFKQVTEEKTFVTSTIVTYLLNKSFTNDSTAKEKIKTEFRRMGLLENSSGKWSLSGIRVYKDIQTLANTFVSDAIGLTILVDKGTILGEELRVSNGMTTFKALDGKLYKVPSRDVAQVR